MTSDDLFSDMDTVASKSSNYVDLHSSPVPQNSCLPAPPHNNAYLPAPPQNNAYLPAPPQNNACLPAPPALNYLRQSDELTNEDLSIIFDLDNHDAI